MSVIRTLVPEKKKQITAEKRTEATILLTLKAVAVYISRNFRERCFLNGSMVCHDECLCSLTFCNCVMFASFVTAPVKIYIRLKLCKTGQSIKGTT